MSSARHPPVASYKGFPSFSEWCEQAPNLRHWDSVMSKFRTELYSDVLERIRLLMKDGAADATTPFGGSTTFRTFCNAQAAAQGCEIDSMFTQSAALFDYTMDFAVRKKNCSHEWICGLHSLIAGDPSGEGTEFPIGNYRRSTTRIVRLSEYSVYGSPAALIRSEMTQYFNELSTQLFRNAHPVLQASYAHYAIVAIHPFADGNGRIARWLAFSFIYRANSIPVLSLEGNRVKYLAALRAADQGEFDPFITLVEECSMASAKLIRSRIWSAMSMSVENGSNRWERSYG
jgi:hypothetical protein